MYMYMYLKGGPQGPRGTLSKARERGPCGPLADQKDSTETAKSGPGDSLRRWVATSRFERSNQELLALDICGAMAILLVRNISAITYL